MGWPVQCVRYLVVPCDSIIDLCGKHYRPVSEPLRPPQQRKYPMKKPSEVPLRVVRPKSPYEQPLSACSWHVRPVGSGEPDIFDDSCARTAAPKLRNRNIVCMVKSFGCLHIELFCVYISRTAHFIISQQPAKGGVALTLRALRFMQCTARHLGHTQYTILLCDIFSHVGFYEHCVVARPFNATPDRREARRFESISWKLPAQPTWTYRYKYIYLTHSSVSQSARITSALTNSRVDLRGKPCPLIEHHADSSTGSLWAFSE
eukprot:284819538_6